MRRAVAAGLLRLLLLVAPKGAVRLGVYRLGPSVEFIPNEGPGRGWLTHHRNRDK